MKIETYIAEVLKLEIVQDYNSDAVKLQYVTTTNPKPVLLGTFEHDGYSVTDKNPITLTLTEQGAKLLRVLAPSKKAEHVSVVVKDQSVEDIPF
jgi:hypothetical protein